MLQHAVYTLPNYEHGYCTDDNARALILMMLLAELEECVPARTRLTSIYAAFSRMHLMESSGDSATSCLIAGIGSRNRLGGQSRAGIMGSWDLRRALPS